MTACLFPPPPSGGALRGGFPLPPFGGEGGLSFLSGEERRSLPKGGRPVAARHVWGAWRWKPVHRTGALPQSRRSSSHGCCQIPEHRMRSDCPSGLSLAGGSGSIAAVRLRCRRDSPLLWVGQQRPFCVSRAGAVGPQSIAMGVRCQDGSACFAQAERARLILWHRTSSLRWSATAALRKQSGRGWSPAQRAPRRLVTGHPCGWSGTKHVRGRGRGPRTLPQGGGAFVTAHHPWALSQHIFPGEREDV